MDVNSLKVGFAVTQSESGDPHVRMVPEVREHNTEGLECWCNPTITAICDECNGSDEGCWNCEKGLKSRTPREAAFEDGPFIVIHRP